MRRSGLTHGLIQPPTIAARPFQHKIENLLWGGRSAPGVRLRLIILLQFPVLAFHLAAEE